MRVMNILGVNMHCLSYSEMYPIFDGWLLDKASRAHALAAINVNTCVSALFSKPLRDMYNAADLAGIDSMPFLMWARAFYHKNSDRFYAPDLLREVSSKAKAKGYTYFFYGGYSGAIDKIEEYLRKQYDGITTVGKYTPPFRALTLEEDDAVCKLINDAHPDFLWMGLGSPKQDVWIHEHLSKIRGCIMIPAGATFDFFSGRISQAPQWIRNLGFEWLYRLTQDFRRLWKRYTIYNMVFIVVFCLQLMRIVAFDKEGFVRVFGQRVRPQNSSGTGASFS